ncbi:MAG: aromatic ring-hydroxylating dioxygenase subunit alpha [Pseudomonadota bacterium]
MAAIGWGTVDQAIIDRITEGMAYEAAREAPPEGFPKLPKIPGGRYVDPDFQALEHERLWRRSWLYAGHIDEFPKSGSFKMFTRTGSPIFLIRGRDDEVRAFYNTCQHRGGPLVKEDCGAVRSLVCGYHGWAYDFTGKLINLRDRRDFNDFDDSEHHLKTVRCERFGNWLFINEDADAEPLIDSLGPVADHFAHFEIDTLRLIESESFDVDCNVKVIQDAFLEVYHLRSIHQKTVDRFLDHTGTSITLWKNGHSLMVTPNRRPDWVDPGTVGMAEIPTMPEVVRTNNFSYNIYPNIVTPTANTGMPFIVFWPLTENTMRLDVHWFAPGEPGEQRDPLWDTRIENFDRILEEDTQFAPQIQASVESPGFDGVPLNYQERRIYHWHEELDRRIGLGNVPDALAVEPVLAPFVTDE